MRFIAPLDKGLRLRSVPLFGDLPADRIAQLVEYATEELLSAGTVFQLADAPVETIRVIVEGDVSCLLRDGKSCRLGPDAVVGVFELFSGGAQATLAAMTDVIALAIPTTAIRRMLEEHFDVVVHLFRGLGRTLIGMLRRAPALAASAVVPTLPPHAAHRELGEVERILALRGTLAFRAASVDGLSAVARTTQVQSFQQGAVLWTDEDDASWLGVILHGVVECETAARTRFYFSEATTSAVGFLDTLGDDRRWYEARALTDVTVLTLRKDDLLDALEDHFDMSLTCLAAFSAFSLAIVGRLRDAPGLPPDEVATARDLTR